MARRKTGSPKTGRRGRTLRALGVSALVAGGVSLIGILALRRAGSLGEAGHAAPDLALDQPRPGTEDRAPVEFRPDPTAAVPQAERESLRPPGLPPTHDVSDPIPV